MEKEEFWSEPNVAPTSVKRQHYVPQMYLRAFAKENKIHVINLDDEKNEFQTSLGNVAVESHFYDVDIVFLASIKGTTFGNHIGDHPTGFNQSSNHSGFPPLDVFLEAIAVPVHFNDVAPVG